MYHFFTDEINTIEGMAVVSGDDYNHIKNVLRLKPGEKAVVSDSNGSVFNCHINSFTEDSVIFNIDEPAENTELPIKITLYQGLAKGEKMDTIIQKAVELGAHKIVPVEMKRCVVKLDDKKKKSRVERWNEISKSAAKQSGRSIVPLVLDVSNFEDAILAAKNANDKIVLPYEEAEGMSELKNILNLLSDSDNISIFIGPEGGFEKSEVDFATKSGAKIVSLGKRILRTETASAALLATLMLSIEMKEI